MKPTPGSLAILGSTGSIGTQTLDIVRENPELFTIKALSAHKNEKLLLEQAKEFYPELVVIGDQEKASALQAELPKNISVLCGAQGVIKAAELESVHTVVAAVVGFAGLESVLAALKAEKHVALANKEALVTGGALVAQALRSSPSCLVPIDSEHSSIYQCLLSRNTEAPIRRIILTASGGPFLKSSQEELSEVTPKDALRHPRWDMGVKISIDSATMMNKGLEVIEASWLFELPSEKIDILVHPQSIVHGLIEFEDSAVIAALSDTDMHLPISFALGRLRAKNPKEKPGNRISKNHMKPLCLEEVGRLEFQTPDIEKFRALPLCYQALRQGGTAPVVLNAANEIAVSAFLEEKIAFLEISEVVADALKHHTREELSGLSSVRNADCWGRDYTSHLLGLDKAQKEQINIL